MNLYQVWLESDQYSRELYFHDSFVEMDGCILFRISRVTSTGFMGRLFGADGDTMDVDLKGDEIKRLSFINFEEGYMPNGNFVSYHPQRSARKGLTTGNLALAGTDAMVRWYYSNHRHSKAFKARGIRKYRDLRITSETPDVYEFLNKVF